MKLSPAESWLLLVCMGFGIYYLMNKLYVKSLESQIHELEDDVDYLLDKIKRIERRAIEQRRKYESNR